MKKILNIFLVIIIMITMVGCEKRTIRSDGEMFAEEYNKENGKESKSGKINRTLNIDKDNPMIYSTAEEIVEKIENNETFIVYFGFSTCPWCRSMIEQLIKCAKDNNQDEIYYVDVLEIRDVMELDEANEAKIKTKGSVGYMKLIELMGNVLSDYELTTEDGTTVATGEKRIYAPNVVAVVDGIPIEMVEGVSKELKDPYAELTDAMKKESYNSLKCIFECLNKDKNENMCQKNAC